MRSSSTLAVMLLSLVASPALASDAASGATTPVASAAGIDHVAAEIDHLSERVTKVEASVERLSPPPTKADLERAAYEEQLRAEDPRHAAALEIMRTLPLP